MNIADITKEKPSEAALEEAVIEEFDCSRKNYGTRKIKAALAKSHVTSLVA